MLNKNVCPNCGQLYDTNLSKCPLCGTAPQVVDTADPVQRKRITEAERKQRRAERKEAAQEERRRRKDAEFMRDADEEREYEEEEARRKEEKRRRKEEKKAARRAAEAEEDEDEEEEKPVFTAAPARDGRGPMPEAQSARDPRRVPRIFLILSALVLLAALAVGGSYLLWKLDVAEIPYYDELAARRNETPAQPIDSENPSEQGMILPSDSTAPVRPAGDSPVPCTDVSLSQTELSFDTVGDQVQITVTRTPANTTDDYYFASSDVAVVKVSPVGIVTAVGPGQATITVTCGSKTAACSVNCTFSEDSVTTEAVAVDHLELNKDDMTFKAPGENYVLSVTNLPAGTEVSWRSLDETICTVDAKGHVVAVGPGTTRVVASYGSLTAECWVRCRFE